MTPKQAQEAGRAFAKAHLDVIEAYYGTEVAAAYASGHAWAARDYVFGLRGARDTYDMMADLADGCLTPVLPR